MTNTDAPETTDNAFKIPEENLGGLQERIAKLNKRARKLGVPEIVVSVDPTPIEEAKTIQITGVEETPWGPVRVEKSVRKEVIRYFMVTVTGVTPKLNGYTFMATLEHVEGEVMLRCAPAVDGDLPKRFRSADPYNCDHCKKRRTRVETFVVRHDETNEFKQVGRQCIADFLGGVDPARIASMAEFLWRACEEAQAAEEGGGFGRAEPRLDLVTFLSFVAAAIRKHGWMSRGRARSLAEAGGAEVATCDLALNVLHTKPHDKNYRYYVDNGYHPTTVDTDTAEKALAWARESMGGKDPDVRNDYEHNVVVATAGDTVIGRSTGIVASVVAGYQRHLQVLVERQLEASKMKDSAFFGEEKKRMAFYGVLFKLFSRDSEFGTSWCHQILTREGNVVVWWTSSRPQFAVVTGDDGEMRQATVEELNAANEGDHSKRIDYAPVEVGTKEYLFIGTVKRHEERNGVKQTVMSRCVVHTDHQRTEHEANEMAKVARAAKKAEKAAAKTAKDAAKAVKAAA